MAHSHLYMIFDWAEHGNAGSGSARLGAARVWQGRIGSGEGTNGAAIINLIRRCPVMPGSPRRGIVGHGRVWGLWPRKVGDENSNSETDGHNALIDACRQYRVGGSDGRMESRSQEPYHVEGW